MWPWQKGNVLTKPRPRPEFGRASQGICSRSFDGQLEPMGPADPRGLIRDAIVLDAENRGVAAKHVHDVCAAFVEVLGWFEEDDEDYRVPKKDWFVKVRKYFS